MLGNDARMKLICPGRATNRGAPLLCAGVTMYDPLVHFGAAKGGKRVAIMGAGGLGMLGVKIAAAMGNEVCVSVKSPRPLPPLT